MIRPGAQVARKLAKLASGEVVTIRWVPVGTIGQMMPPSSEVEIFDLSGMTDSLKKTGPSMAGYSIDVAPGTPCGVFAQNVW
ncbi:MAG: hypothetical protein IPK93_08905 [Solirubrobacterales bacterium]|nr:hypothetical protein [Solirubrobacterales bacterium]